MRSTLHLTSAPDSSAYGFRSEIGDKDFSIAIARVIDALKTEGEGGREVHVFNDGGYYMGGMYGVWAVSRWTVTR